MAQLDRGTSSGSPKSIEDPLSAIKHVLEKLRFGSIALTVHDGKVVQLDITEKRRLF